MAPASSKEFLDILANYRRGREVGQPPTNFSKTGGLKGPQVLERGDLLFSGGSKLKSGMFNDKKSS